MKVKRSSGAIEDWEVWGVDEQRRTATVRKIGKGGEATLSRSVSLEDIGKWKEESGMEQKKEKPLTLENIREAILKGEPMPVKVKRMSGAIELGWQVTKIVDAEKEIVTVKNFQIPGTPLRKDVTFKDLKKWNS